MHKMHARVCAVVSGLNREYLLPEFFVVLHRACETKMYVLLVEMQVV